MMAPSAPGKGPSLPTLVSVHDLMPETMHGVEAVLQAVADAHLPPPTLLVVPGREWDDAGIARLHELQAAGHELAAHGWYHQATERRDLYHRLHSLIISHDVAEHLSQPTTALQDLLNRSHAWFAEQGLTPPTLYVPPAWALGRLSLTQLQASPFEQVETLNGVWQIRSGRFIPLPLVGFEADTTLRAAPLSVFNRFNAWKARRRQKPLRIAIHPADLTLRLAADLRALLHRELTPVRYADLGPVGGPQTGHPA